MRPSVLTTVGVLALACTLAPSATAAQLDATARTTQRSRHCHVPAGATMLARGPRLVLWLATHSRRSATPPPLWESSETYAACVPPRGPTRVIARLTEEGPVQCGSSIALKHAGSFVATVNSGGCSTGSWQGLELHDVLHGHTTEVIYYSQAILQRPDTPTSLAPLGAPFGLSISRFALDARGNVAWSGSNFAQPGEPSLDVLYLHDAAGTRRVAAAPSIGRIAFKGSELTWRAYGSAHSVPG